MQYNVHFDGNRVIIAHPDYAPTDVKLIGTFEHDVAEGSNITSPATISRNGDHIFIAKAKEVLEDNDIEVTSHLTFLDQASNAPLHDEDMNYHTDALSVSEDDTHANASSQAGGEVSTVGTNPFDTDTNGVTKNDADGNETADKRELPAEFETEGSIFDEEGEQEQSQTEQADDSTTEVADEKADDAEKPQAETVADLKARIAKITDKAELEAAYKAENEGQKRTTALKAIEDRAEELNAE